MSDAAQSEFDYTALKNDRRKLNLIQSQASFGL